MLRNSLRSTARSITLSTRLYSASNLGKHIAFFADQDGNVTLASVTKKFIQLGESESSAAVKAAVIMAAAGTSVKYCPFRMFKPEEAVGVLNHARDTSIFNLDGSINEAQWQRLSAYAEIDHGKQIITKTRLLEFLQLCRSEDARHDLFGIGKAASDGEWNDFFKQFTDHWKQTADGLEACVTLSTLRQFYEDGGKAFQRVVDGELPVKRHQ